MHSNPVPRRRHGAELKAKVLAACNEPGASIAAVALSHGLNANLVRKWLVGRGLKRTGAFEPVHMSTAVESDLSWRQGTCPLLGGAYARRSTWPRHAPGSALEILMKINQYVVCVIFLLLGSSAFGQDSKVNSLSRDDFANIVGPTAIRLMPNRGGRGGTKLQQALSDAKWTDCVLDLLGIYIAAVYDSDTKPKPIELIKLKVQSLISVDIERQVSKHCRVHFEGRTGRLSKSVIAILDDPKRATAAIEKEKTAQEAAKSNLASRVAGLDVLGIQPGISSKDDLTRIAQAREGDCNQECWTLTVGGYDLECEAEYDDHERVSVLTCWFGGGQSGTNIEIFNVLENGFTQKFGKPRVRLAFQMQTVVGAKFDVVNPKWLDKQGNTLEMASRVERIDRGAFALKSAAKNAEEVIEREQIRKARKF